MKCTYCGNEMSEGARFCGKCGKDVKEALSYCHKCGTKLNPNSMFCNRCGVIITGKRKKRMCKLYSLIMLAIFALVVLFTPAVRIAGEHYNATYDVRTYINKGYASLTWDRTGEINNDDQKILLVIAGVCIALLLASAGLRFVNKWWASLIPAAVSGIMLLIGDVMALSFSDNSVAHLGIGFAFHFVFILFLLGSFWLDRARTRYRKTDDSYQKYKITPIDIITIAIYGVFLVSTLIFSIVSFSRGISENSEIFLETPEKKYKNWREMVCEEAKKKCEDNGYSTDGYYVRKVANDDNGRFIVLLYRNDYSQIYAVFIQNPDIYTGEFQLYENEPVRTAYSMESAIEKAKPSKWGKENYTYQKILNSYNQMHEGGEVSDIFYWDW